MTDTYYPSVPMSILEKELCFKVKELDEVTSSYGDRDYRYVYSVEREYMVECPYNGQVRATVCKTWHCECKFVSVVFEAMYDNGEWAPLNFTNEDGQDDLNQCRYVPTITVDDPSTEDMLYVHDCYKQHQIKYLEQL